MHRGYLKLWRKVEDSGLLQIPLTYALFTFILLKATHKPRKIGTPHGVVELQRGEYMSGRIALARDLNQSEQSIRTGLDRLQKMEILTITSTSRYSIYTIVNYGNYQDDNQESTSPDPMDNQHLTNGQPAGNQQSTTKQTHKHNKNEKNVRIKSPSDYSDEFEQAWSEYPKREGASKKDSFKAWNARLKSGVLPSAMIEGVKRYASYCKAREIESQFIKQPATFFGPSEHYLNDWDIPKDAKKSPVLAWWATNELMLAKGKELGTEPRPGEGWQEFKSRLSKMVSEK